MNAKFTEIWLVLAAALLGFILLVERKWERPEKGPRALLPGFNPEEVLAVEVHGPGRPLVRAERKEGRWWLVEPVRDPANGERIEALCWALASEPVQTALGRAELLAKPEALEEFGLETPVVTLRLWMPDRVAQIQFGHRTAPGDQVFVQLVGADEVWVVSSEILRGLAERPEDWRERRWFDFGRDAFDRLVVSNRWGRFALERQPSSKDWWLTEPLRARADSDRIEALCRELVELKVASFESEATEADLELYGLQPPVWMLSLFHGTNAVGRFEFGRTATNRDDLVYGRQEGRGVIVTLPAKPMEPWQVAHTEFRDRRLLRWREPVAAIEFLGENSFAVHRLPGQWRLLPSDLPADPALVEAVLAQLERLEISEFVKDVVIEPDLMRYGLAPPARHIVLRRASSGTGDATQTVLGEIQLGLMQEGKVYVRRPDEPAVYAVSAAEVSRLPKALYQLRDRRIWRLDETRVATVRIQEGARRWDLVRHGDYAYALAPGSQGVINSLAVGEAVRALCELDAVAWLGVGEEALREHELDQGTWSVTLHLTDGQDLTVIFGRPRPELPLLGVVRLEGNPWVFLTSPVVQELVWAYLKLPAIPPP